MFQLNRNTTGNGEKQIGRAYGAPRQPSTLTGTGGTALRVALRAYPR